MSPFGRKRLRKELRCGLAERLPVVAVERAAELHSPRWLLRLGVRPWAVSLSTWKRLVLPEAREREVERERLVRPGCTARGTSGMRWAAPRAQRQGSTCGLWTHCWCSLGGGRGRRSNGTGGAVGGGNHLSRVDDGGAGAEVLLVSERKADRLLGHMRGQGGAQQQRRQWR